MSSKHSAFTSRVCGTDCSFRLRDQHTVRFRFQIRLVQRILATNVLVHMGVENDATCSFNGKERDAIENFFFFEMRTCKTILGTITDSSK